jgi:type II secretory pathway component GspD/PulD (secretin)
MVSGKPGRIFIGDEIRYISETILGPGQSSQTTEVVPVGILLDAVGTVGADSEITLYLHPEVSTVTKYVGNIPQIARRYTDSTIRIKDGSTVIIGGLIKEEDIQTMSKIPLLGDLPILGQLFRNNNKSKVKSEVTIFIKATILKDQ